MKNLSLVTDRESRDQDGMTSPKIIPQSQKPRRIIIIFEAVNAHRAEVIIRHVASESPGDATAFSLAHLDYSESRERAAANVCEIEIMAMTVCHDRMAPANVPFWRGLGIGFRSLGQSKAMVMLAGTKVMVRSAPFWSKHLGGIAALGRPDFFSRN